MGADVLWSATINGSPMTVSTSRGDTTSIVFSESVPNGSILEVSATIDGYVVSHSVKILVSYPVVNLSNSGSSIIIDSSTLAIEIVGSDSIVSSKPIVIEPRSSPLTILLKDVTIDKYGYAMGTIPATPGKEDAPVIGFLAHVEVENVETCIKGVVAIIEDGGDSDVYANVSSIGTGIGNEYFLGNSVVPNALFVIANSGNQVSEIFVEVLVEIDVNVTNGEYIVFSVSVL